MHNTKTSLTQVTDIAKLLKNFVVLVMVWSLTAAPQMALAQSSAPAKEKPAATKPSAVPESKSGGGPHEGIKVHGHWIIDVRNPDGSVVSRHEFENSLVTPSPLAKILGRQTTPSTWGISMSSSPAIFADASNNPYFQGLINEPATDAPACSDCFYNLKLTVSGSGSLVLSGTAQATFSGSILSVDTALSGCSPTTAPASQPSYSCDGHSSAYFTMRSLSLPIPVTAGQHIDVTVTISFS